METTKTFLGYRIKLVAELVEKVYYYRRDACMGSVPYATEAQQVFTVLPSDEDLSKAISGLSSMQVHGKHETNDLPLNEAVITVLVEEVFEETNEMRLDMARVRQDEVSMKHKFKGFLSGLTAGEKAALALKLGYDPNDLKMFDK